MMRFAAKAAGRCALGLIGALVMAAAVSTLAMPRAPGASAYLSALAARLAAFAAGDFGRSLISGQSALADIAARCPATFTLLIDGALVALLVGAPLGILFGSGPVRRAAAPLMQVVGAAPVFCAGLALAYGAAHGLGWPVDLVQPMAAPLLVPPDFPAFQRVALPALTVGLAGAASVQLALRRAVAEVAEAPYRAGLRHMGLSALDINLLYVAPQMLAGLLAHLGEIVLALLSAAVVAEWVFEVPGTADLFVKSVALQDWNLAGLILLLFASLTLLADFAGALAAQALANEALANAEETP